MEFIKIADRVEQINYWLGLFLNLLLVHLILHSTQTKLGSYKYLQITFVVNDIVYSSYSFVMQEKMITKGHTFTLFLTSPYGDNLHLVCLYASLFSLILVIVAFNFLYRYWAVVNPQRIKLFSTCWFPLVLALVALTEFSAWHSNSYFMYVASDEARADLAPEFELKYGLDARTRAMIMGDYWRNGHYNVRPLVGLAIFCGILCSGLAFMIFCSVSILHHLSKAKSLSIKTRQLQYELFRILSIQTLIPLLFVHSDAGQVLILPAFGIDSSVLCDWCSMIVSFFPPLDAIAVILLMRDYREAIMTVIACRFRRTNVIQGVPSIFDVSTTNAQTAWNHR